jgi:hypothetical protein
MPDVLIARSTPSLGRWQHLAVLASAACFPITYSLSHAAMRFNCYAINLIMTDGHSYFTQTGQLGGTH